MAKDRQDQQKKSGPNNSGHNNQSSSRPLRVDYSHRSLQTNRSGDYNNHHHSEHSGRGGHHGGGRGGMRSPTDRHRYERQRNNGNDGCGRSNREQEPQLVQEQQATPKTRHQSGSCTASPWSGSDSDRLFSRRQGQPPHKEEDDSHHEQLVTSQSPPQYQAGYNERRGFRKSFRGFGGRGRGRGGRGAYNQDQMVLRRYHSADTVQPNQALLPRPDSVQSVQQQPHQGTVVTNSDTVATTSGDQDPCGDPACHHCRDLTESAQVPFHPAEPVYSYGGQEVTALLVMPTGHQYNIPVGVAVQAMQAASYQQHQPFALHPAPLGPTYWPGMTASMATVALGPPTFVVAMEAGQGGDLPALPASSPRSSPEGMAELSPIPNPGQQGGQHPMQGHDVAYYGQWNVPKN